VIIRVNQWTKKAVETKGTPQYQLLFMHKIEKNNAYQKTFLIYFGSGTELKF
jgi:hypothetical protein